MKLSILPALCLAFFPPAVALAGEARPVPHGMIVTTDDGEEVRVLAFADGTFRVTIGGDLPQEPSTAISLESPPGMSRSA